MVTPGMPTGVYGVQISSGIGQVWVRWAAPADDNSTIFAYEVTYTMSEGAVPGEGGVNLTGNPSATSINLTDLRTDSAYAFYVRAINPAGAGAMSMPSDEVFLTPGRILSSSAALSNPRAGSLASLILNFTCEHILPSDAHIFIELPDTFGMMATTAAANALAGISGNIKALVDNLSIALVVSGSTTDVTPGTLISLVIANVTNPGFCGTTASFAGIRTTRNDTTITIDEASAKYNSDNLPHGLYIDPGKFRSAPTLLLAKNTAGAKTTANLSLTTSNPLPPDGHIVVAFPRAFTSLNCRRVGSSDMDGGLAVSVDAETRTVDVQRDGTGTEIPAGTPLIVVLDGIVNQCFEGDSDVFPMVKTTLADVNVSIDEASADTNSGDRPRPVAFTPAAFVVPPRVSLSSYIAGRETAADITFTTANPLPVDGRILVEFPTSFASIAVTSVNASDLDGGLAASTGVDGYTVEIARDGTGTEVASGTEVWIRLLGGIVNQRFEGPSSVFPTVKTTLADRNVSIDEASQDIHHGHRPIEVVFTPSRFVERPNVTLGSYEAGVATTANLSLTTSNPLPPDGHIVVAFPRAFTYVNCSRVGSSDMDGGLAVSVDAETRTVDVQRDGTGTEIPAGTPLIVVLDGIVNQRFEGDSDVFPMVKTTLADVNVSIDEASADANSGDRPRPVAFTPAAFVVPPRVSLSSYIAGRETAADITFTTANPLPVDGRILVEFPRSFASITITSVNASGLDGGLAAFTGVDGYTVEIARDGTGTEVASGTEVWIRLLGGIVNQRFEGPSSVFPTVKTTLADRNVSIDEASQDIHHGHRPIEVVFTPSRFVERPNVTLGSYEAGVATTANLSLTTSNPLPPDAHIVVAFPRAFTSLNCSRVGSSDMDGGLAVSVDAETRTVDVQRDGTGTEIPAGTPLIVVLDGIVNQRFEGDSDVFPMVKTTLADVNVSIDEASADTNSGDRPRLVAFTPAAFVVPPRVSLSSYIAGRETAADVTFTTANPLPVDGRILVEFPRSFASIAVTSVNASGLDGGLAASTGVDGYTVEIARDGTGTEVASGTDVWIRLLGGIVNQRFESPSSVFPTVKTTLADRNVSIDEASQDIHHGHRPTEVVFTPSRFVERPNVTLGSYEAGVATTANLSLMTSNPLPPDGHIVVAFPRAFTSLNCSRVGSSDMDGGLAVSVDAETRTVDVQRDGTGTEIPEGTPLIVVLDGIVNQCFEGDSDVFPMVKTTLADVNVSIDEASADNNSGDRPRPVAFTPAAFVVPPRVSLSSYIAGRETAADITFTTANPLPVDGRILVEFPRSFASIAVTSVNASDLDGGLAASTGVDGYTVEIARDGTGTEVASGTDVWIRLLGGIVNQRFEGPSSVFPTVKTTLADRNVSIDEASQDIHHGHRPIEVVFTPSRFVDRPNVTLGSYEAGVATTANLSLTTSNPLPPDGHIVVAFPRAFTSINCRRVGSSDMDGGLAVSVDAETRTVDVQRDGTGTEIPAGTPLIVVLDGIVNQCFEGDSDVFPMVKTTLADVNVSIDEASADTNSGDRPRPVAFTPAAFVVPPRVSLSSYITGRETAADITFTTANPLPGDGRILVEFPTSFASIPITSVNASDLDGGLAASTGVDGYTVEIARDGTGTEVASGTDVWIRLLGGIVNQRFEGPSSVFPTVKTTLADRNVSIDEASQDIHHGHRPTEVVFTPSRFVERPNVTLGSYEAGVATTANLSLTTSNPLPPDGHIVVAFPRAFTYVNCSRVGSSDMDGGLAVSVDAETRTVDVHRDGTGTEIPAGTPLIVVLDGIVNQRFEGDSDVFPMVKTTLADVNVSIDEASADTNSGDRPRPVAFTPAAFVVPPRVSLSSYIAGRETAADITFTTANSLPVDGRILVEFPRSFASIAVTSVNSSGLDGGLAASTGVDGYTVEIARDGTGTEVASGTEVWIRLLGGIVNQRFEGPSSVFPTVKTTLADRNVSIDEASQDIHHGHRPIEVVFTPSRFVERPNVTLGSYEAGVATTANLSLMTSNPLPPDGHIVVAFPRAFTSINCRRVGSSDMDGGLAVSVDAETRTVDVQRDGTGTEIPAGTPLIVVLDGIVNQRFEGDSDVFPMVKTTLADVNVSIDEASADTNSGDRPRPVAFTPAAFVVPPRVSLSSYIAGRETAADITFTTANPLPVDGRILVEFPTSFASIAVTSVNASGLDGGLAASTGVDGYTVEIARDGTGTEVAPGTEVWIRLLGGIVNQRFEGPSSVFPTVKTTLADRNVSIDEASQDIHHGHRPIQVIFTPSRFVERPNVTLGSYEAGVATTANLSLTTSNPLPPDGHIVVAFPRAFTSLNCSRVGSSDMDGGLAVSVDAETRTVDVQRDGTGTEIPAGTPLIVVLDGIVNQCFEGDSDVFPMVKTTLADVNVSIDEASADNNSGDRPRPVAFTPAAFVVPPRVSLSSYIAGRETAADITFTTANSLPVDGRILVEFPRSFASIAVTSVNSSGLDGGLEASTGVDGYTVEIARDGTGTEVASGTEVWIRLLGGIVNQRFEGPSSVFPTVKTTLADRNVSIDEASQDIHHGHRPIEVVFTPSRFVERPNVTLGSYEAGVATTANLSLTTSNPLPPDGHIVVAFPRAFTSINCSRVGSSDMDGGLAVSVDAETRTVDVQRDGTGTEIPAGTPLIVVLDGIVNQCFEGDSDVFPMVKTTLADVNVSIDEASADTNSGDRPRPVAFTPAAFVVPPRVSLSSYIAGRETAADITFTTANPLPVDGRILVEFPTSFASIAVTSVNASDLDGGLAASTGVDGYTVEIARDDNGTEVAPGTEVWIRLLGGIVNQRFEGPSSVFPTVKTTLADRNVSIDEASQDIHHGHRPTEVVFTPSRFVERPNVTLGSYEAGVATTANLSLTTSNPLPPDGHIVVAFPRAFTSLNCRRVGSSDMDGGLAVSVDAETRTVDVQRDGTGTEIPAGTPLIVVLDGIVNQCFEGDSDVFPMVKTTLADVNVSIDEASADTNSGDRPRLVAFTPAAFVVPPRVSLSSYIAGRETAADVTFTTANSLPVDGRILVEFPRSFASIAVTSVNASGLDGGLAASTGVDGYTVEIARDGTGTEVASGTEVWIRLLGGIVNQRFESPSSVFPTVKTTLADRNVSIDEASQDIHHGHRPTEVVFTASRFVERPNVTLGSYEAGVATTANLSLTTSNPLPPDGHIVVAFPRAFTSLNCSRVGSSDMDGGLAVSVDAETRTVDVQRDGTGTEIPAGTPLIVVLDGIVNQRFEGDSDVFPMVKTTLADVNVSIDEASADTNSGDRPRPVAFTPAAFVVPPRVSLSSYIAGRETAADITFTTANPLPVDGCIVVEFPTSFASIAVTSVNASDLDGGLAASTGVDGYTVEIARDGTGTEVASGTEVWIRLLGGIVNQRFEGPSSVFPTVKTTLADRNVSIDEASQDIHHGHRPIEVVFTPSRFVDRPNVTLGSYEAGVATTANLSLTTSNPLPPDAHIVVAFPRAFTSLNCSRVGSSDMDGGLAVSVDAETRTVDVQRDGTGTEIPAGTPLIVVLDGIVNQRFEGDSDVFPMVKTTLADVNVSIDEASADTNSGDRPRPVAFTPAAFVVPPRVSLSSYIAGRETAADITFTTANPLPVDGCIVVEFPTSFASIAVTSVNASDLDGGLAASTGVDGYTVEIARDGTGTEVASGTEVWIRLLGGIVNQRFEGPSSVFPTVKTTLADRNVSIDEASQDIHHGHRPIEVVFTPSRFVERPNVTLGSYEAGVATTANLSLTTSNPLPPDAHIVVAFPRAFTSLNCSRVGSSDMDGGLAVSVDAETRTVDVQRDGTGTEIPAGTPLIVVLDGIVNQRFEGDSDVFPMVKTTLADVNVSIDEASADTNSGDRPRLVAFTPAAFVVPPRVSLSSYIAGRETAADITFTTTNPLPVDGRILVEFPRSFASIAVTSVNASGLDGGLAASTGVDGYTVEIARDGSGTEVASGTEVWIRLLGGIVNQRFEGPSSVFPTVKTTLADRNVSIDEASQDINEDDRAGEIVIFPSSFVGSTHVVLQTSFAGASGGANVSLRTSNPFPIDGHVVIEFPRNFVHVHVSSVTVVGADGGFVVVSDPGDHIVDIRRDGNGTEVMMGSTLTLELFGDITNQGYEGPSSVFPMVKTTLSDVNISIDEASSSINSDGRPSPVVFVPAPFAVPPTVSLSSYSAGAQVTAIVSFVLSNPLPNDAHVVISFPSSFVSVDVATVNGSGLDGGFVVSSEAADPYTVDLHRDGSGTEVIAGSAVSLELVNALTNQRFEGLSPMFPLVKTTLNDSHVSIDEASARANGQDLPAPVLFTPAPFSVAPMVELESYTAGVESAVRISFTLSNPLPANGHIVIGFPRNFSSINCSEARVSNIDGSFIVAMEAASYVVDVERDGSGTDVAAGTAVLVYLKNGVINQQFEGRSSVFPLVKTTLANRSVSIDEVSSETNSDSRPAGVRFTSAPFAATPSVRLDTYLAGARAQANISFTTSNPLPSDGHILVRFPDNFTSIDSTRLSVWGIDGSFTVLVEADGYTLDIRRDGRGMELVSGSPVSILLDNVVNQHFEGESERFPYIRTTLANNSVSIDDSRHGEPLPVIRFAAAALLHSTVELRYDVAGMRTDVNVSFVTSNPLPHTAVVVIDFPRDFAEATPSTAESPQLDPLSVNGSYAVTLRRDGSGATAPPGSEIHILLATVVNRPTAGETGNFTLTTFTDYSMKYRVDTGVASPAVVGKQILDATAGFGSSSVAVVRQAKYWIFNGFGITPGDQFKWTNASATSDEHCDWLSTTRLYSVTVSGNTSSTPHIAFTHSSQRSGPLKMCFKFSNNPFKLYPDIALDVYEVTEVEAASEGRTSISIVGYSKSLSLSGFGIAEDDAARWILPGANGCTDDDKIAALVSRDDGGNNSVLVSSLRSITFEFSVDVFAAVENAGGEGAYATLCYKFGSEMFQHFPKISISIRHVTGWTSSVGGSSVAVAGVQENVTFTGYGISSGDAVGDRAWWILEGTNCSANVAEIAGSLNNVAGVSKGEASFTFGESAAGETPRLCYAFEDEPPMLYPSLTIKVAFLSRISAPRFGDADVAVVDSTKPWGFSGGHIDDGDTVRWIFNDSSDCSDNRNMVEMEEDGLITSGETNCTFRAAASGKWITPCYRHGNGNEPWRRYSWPVFVKMVSIVWASWGGDSACVAEQPKQWAFDGDGLTADGATDLIKFTVGDGDCGSDSDAGIRKSDFGGVAMYLTQGRNATIDFESSVAGHFVFLCYKFGNEVFQWYNISTYVHNLRSVRSLTGGTDIAVVDTQELLVVHANGSSSLDRIRWISAVDQTASDDSCNGSAVQIWDGSGEDAHPTTEAPVIDAEGIFLANFTFRNTSAGLSPTLCYKFSDERWKIYPEITIDVAMVQVVEASEGSDSVAVVDYPKMWSFTGQFLAPGDQMFWTMSSCDAGRREAKLVEGGGSAVRLGDSLAPWITFRSSATGSTVHVCYRFNDEPFKEYREFEVDIRMIHTVAVDYGSSSRTLPEVAKTFSFIGDGIASEDGIDRAKWIEGENCSLRGIFGYVDNVGRSSAFDLSYSDASGFTVQTITFEESEVGGPYALCYSFGIEPYKLYHSSVITVLGITGVAAEEGAADKIVLGAPKRLTFSGGDAVEPGDRIIWATGVKRDSDCTIDSFLDGPRSVVDTLLQAEFNIPETNRSRMAGRTWTLCYQFGTELFKVYPSFTLTSVTLDNFTAKAGADDDSVVGYKKTFLIAGSGVLEGDRAKWVSASVMNSVGCESDTTTDESLVVRVPWSTEAQPETVNQGGFLETSFTFASPTIGGADLQLCYKHQSEPFRLYRGFTLGVRQLQSASIRSLGAEQTLRAIVYSPQLISFRAHGGMEGDRYKWVQPIRNTSSSAAVTVDNCAEEVEPAAGSSIGVATGFYQDAPFTFHERASGLVLCYGPGAEPYMVYPEITMEVFSPTVTAANRTHLLVGKPRNVRLIGTFGISSGDALKLAENADGDCDGEAAGGGGTIFFPHGTSVGLTDPNTGTSDITLQVRQRTEANRPFKLCYRFGAGGNWQLFNTIAWEAFEVTSVRVDLGDEAPASGDLLHFTFDGTGINDGDEAKWVDGEVSSDGDCESASTVAASAVGVITAGGVAQFAFQSAVEQWTLCYKHGYDDWVLYPGVTPTMSSVVAKKTTSETQWTRASVSVTLEGNIAAFPPRSAARSDFEAAFLADVASALGEDISRFVVRDVRAGSVVVEFTINPTGSLADRSVNELLADLDSQISNGSSALRHGNVTSLAKGLTYTTSTLEESPSLESTSVISLSVVEFQPKGLFGFGSTSWYTTEASGKVNLTVLRDHGTRGLMDVGYTLSDGSTSGAEDYFISSDFIRFRDGQTKGVIQISLIDDDEVERHFETLTVTLSLRGPINDGAALRPSASTSTVLLYDYGDGVTLANTDFGAQTARLTAPDESPRGSTSPDDVGTDSLEETGNYSDNKHATAGWVIIDNGEGVGWVDSYGFGAQDAIVGGDEYDDRCDYASTRPCDHDCLFGGGLAELFPNDSSQEPYVLQLDGEGYVYTPEPLSDFPSTGLSVSFWVRLTSSDAGIGGAVVLSYTAPDASAGDSEFLLHSLQDLRLLVHGAYVSASERYDGPSGGDLSGIKLGIDITQDQSWHHVSVTWRSADGGVAAFLDGVRVFKGGPYKTGARLTPGGTLILGQPHASICAAHGDTHEHPDPGSPPAATGCGSSGERGGRLTGLVGEIQHLRVWSIVISTVEVAQQMHQPFVGNSVGQVLHWDFSVAAARESGFVKDSSGIGESTTATPNNGRLSDQGSAVVWGWPSLNPGYPCGRVHSGIWRFAAPEEYLTGLRRGSAYGGRLQFRLAHTTADGDVRSTRGAVTVRTRGGQKISWTCVFGAGNAEPGEWTFISVVLREDHGWLREPQGMPLTSAEMRAILADAGGLTIRGDMRVYGKTGGGQELVYLQGVKLFPRH